MVSIRGTTSREVDSIVAAERAFDMRKAAACRAIPSPRTFFCVSDKRHRGVYPDRESANMARSEGHVSIRESASVVTEHDTMAEAMQELGRYASAGGGGHPLTGTAGP